MLHCKKYPFVYVIVLVFSMTVIPVAGNAAGIYKWRDANGQIHFGDHPPGEAKTERVSVRLNVYQTPSFERLSKLLETDNKIVLYSASWCGYCKQARQYFEAHNIPYTEYDVEKSEKGKRDYKRMGARGVPVILIGDRRMNGFNVAAFEKFYNSR
jgi:glutaredoxin